MEIKKEDKILVIAPHPDDESIGAGGLLALYGSQCDVLLLTDGRHGHLLEDCDENELISVRKSEIEEACRIAQVNHFVSLNIEDRTMNENKNILSDFSVKLYDYIFVPNRYESHVDHKVVYSIVYKMIKKQKSKARLYEYEVWTTLRSPTDYVDISSVIDIKRKMIECHKSQLEDCDYAEKGIALSNYRGMYAHCGYAEAFTESSKMKRNEFKQMLSLDCLNILRKFRRGR